MKKLIPMINEAGRHASGILTRLCDAALTFPALVKAGSDDDHVAVATAATEAPLGVTTHATDAAEDEVGVELFGSPGTKRLVASAAIDAGDRICAAAAGKAQKLPTAAGSYYVIGRALTDASGDTVEFEAETCVPYLVVVTE